MHSMYNTLKSAALFLLIASPCFGQAFTPIRVRCGSTVAYTDTKGNVWSPDKGSNGGSVYSTTNKISGTNDPAIFQNERYAAGIPLIYTFTVPNGNYIVNLSFAEIYFTASGSRVFTVVEEGVPVFSKLDIFAAAGSNVALIKTNNVTVTNGKLTVEFDSLVNNGKVDGIEILSALPQPINLTLTGSLLWSDGTPILPGGSFTLQQFENSVAMSVGTISSDPNGNLSGTVKIDPNFADTNGNITLSLAILGIPTHLSETIQLSEFQQSSTGATISIVMFHADQTIPGSTVGPLKTFSFALVP